MQFSRSLSALTVPLLATSAALLAQTTGRSNSAQVAHIDPFFELGKSCPPPDHAPKTLSY
jgi:hypothetical protein